MLRPAYSLPAEQLSLVHGLWSASLARIPLGLRPGSATRRVATYRDGTCTRWITTA